MAESLYPLLLAFVAGMMFLHWIDSHRTRNLVQSVRCLNDRNAKLRREVADLEGEINRECDYAQRLLDDPTFYANERRVIEVVCRPRGLEWTSRN